MILSDEFYGGALIATVHAFSVLLKIIRSHQIILDRLREARTAVGEHGFGDRIHQDFASAVSDHRAAEAAAAAR